MRQAVHHPQQLYWGTRRVTDTDCHKPNQLVKSFVIQRVFQASIACLLY